MKPFSLPLLVGVLMFSAQCFAQNDTQCKTLYKTENYQSAYRVCALAAQQGYVVGRYYAGVMMVQGLGGPKNEIQGVAYLEMAAEKGFSDAQRDLGTAYHLGIARKVNLDKAMYWYKEAVRNKNVPAMLYVASLYHAGEGVEKDFPQSYAYTALAASYGSDQAIEALKALEGMAEFTPEVKEKGRKLKHQLIRELQ
ncbi:tetratricopeptide repeat protein [Teredinibacter franksiae]|uniref:tetratricopeptide repeat protein n=1 Tax=Teredinibacter franksiae TaxID=2761453 RepID=UPI0016282D38|nr:tetratricopeptide repeat protein [Teredinibacter franksiae]